MLKRCFISLLALFAGSSAAAPAGNSVKIGVLAFGTVNWELEAIRSEGLDKKHGLTLEVQKLAGPDAGKIGLQGGGLDVIATDWIWVANQNQAGAAYRFVPYSTQAGAVLAPAGSTVKTVADLKGKKIGVAGGALDKNWVLLKAYAKKAAGLDLDKDAEPVFAAPPLLNQQLADGKLDAVLTFWHYAAKLEAQGFKRVLDGREVLKGLGFDQPPPNLGLVFKQSWAEAHQPALDALLQAAAEARGLLCGNDAVWQKTAPATQEPNPALQAVLRKEYCAGLVQHWTDADRQAVAKVYGVLHQVGGEALTGKAAKLPDGVFWPYKMP